MSLLIAAIAALVALLIAASPAPAQENSGEATGSDYQSRELEMVEAINGYREDNGLSRLEVADTASKAAERHSEDMATYDFFDHDTLESDYYQSGASFADRMSDEGYDYNTYRSENIAAGHEDVQETLTQWKNSPGHNENMLNPELEVIGIGKVCSDGSEHGCYWTTDFGSYTPDSARPVGEIESSSGSDQDTPNEQSTEDRSADSGEANEPVTGEPATGTEGSSGDTDETGGADGEESTTNRSTINKSSTNRSTNSSGEDASGGDGSNQSRQTVQITENGETKTLEGEEAEKEICKQFDATREEVISDLREGAGSDSGSTPSAPTGHGESGDPAAAIKNDIADGFEKSLLNPDSCEENTGDGSGGSDESSTGDSGSGADTADNGTGNGGAGNGEGEPAGNGEPGADGEGNGEGNDEPVGDPASDQNMDESGEKDSASSGQYTGGDADSGPTDKSNGRDNASSATHNTKDSGEDSGEEAAPNEDSSGDAGSTGENTTSEDTTSDETTTAEMTGEQEASNDNGRSTDSGDGGNSGGEQDPGDAGDEKGGENDLSALMMFWE